MTCCLARSSARFDNIGIKFRPVGVTYKNFNAAFNVRWYPDRFTAAQFGMTDPTPSDPDEQRVVVGLQRRLDLGAEVVRLLRVYSGRSASMTSTRDARAAGTSDASSAAAMAFVSIGLETSLGTLVTTDQGRPAIAFLGGQAFNILVTFVAAYVFFGGFPFAP